MGKALRRGAGEGGSGGQAGLTTGNGEQGTGNWKLRGPQRAASVSGSRFEIPRWRAALVAIALWLAPAVASAQDALRFDRGRFTVLAYPSDRQLGQSLLAAATAHDTFPGLPRPRQQVVIAVAPDRARFRAWIGPNAPEWGAAVAFPESRRIVMQASTTRSVGFRLSVADDGRGIANDWLGSGFGLTSMQERAERIGGSLTIVTAPRAGTEVVLAWEPPPFSLVAE